MAFAFLFISVTIISLIRRTELISSAAHFSEVLFTTSAQISKDFLGDKLSKSFSEFDAGLSGFPAHFTEVICSGLNQIIISAGSLLIVHAKIPDAISLYFFAG